jgi:hypothetical protein
MEKDVDEDDLAEISNQIRNSRAELSHQRSNTMNTTSIEIGHKRQFPNQTTTGKGANTDVRTKRQSSSTIPTSSVNNLDDIDMNR